MTKFESKKFGTGANSKAFVDNWDRAFGRVTDDGEGKVFRAYVMGVHVPAREPHRIHASKLRPGLVPSCRKCGAVYGREDSLVFVQACDCEVRG